MPLHLSWDDITLRLVLSLIAGALVGVDRTERGRAAGLRTTILVCLAASVSMIQTNLLLMTVGKTPDSFGALDFMRLPLGILTGMGFIGAGAILRHGDRVQGITTAATLWLVTVIGLCLGGGQIALGLTTLALTLFVLWALKRVETHMHQQRRATLSLLIHDGGPTEGELWTILLGSGFQITSWDITSIRADAVPMRKVRCEVLWRGRFEELLPPPIIRQLAERPGVTKLRWKVRRLPREGTQS